jgi:hypothetical protein
VDTRIPIGFRNEKERKGGIMNLRRKAFVVFLCLMMVPFLTAQVTRQNGVIKGTVVEADGTPVPGATVTALSPALMGSITSLTGPDGVYRLINLPPGIYSLTAELTGFKTVKREDIKVEIGQTYTVELKTEVSSIQEEITVIGTPPVVDLASNKITSVISTELLYNLPLNRAIGNLFNITAGAAGSIAAYSGSVHGANSGSTAYEIDGVNGESPTTGGMQVQPQFESVEEVEISTGGLQAQYGASGGSFISVVTKSGGNQFHGQAQAYYTATGLNQMLFTDEELASMKKSKPGFAKYDVDASASLGGPIIKDKLWFYSTLDYRQNEYTFSFDPVTLEGKTYGAYTNPTKTWAPFIKLTTQISKDMRLFVMFNGSYSDSYYNAGYYNVEDAVTKSLPKTSAIAAELNWILGPNTVVAFHASYNNLNWALTNQSSSRSNVSKYDAYTGYLWGTGGEEQYTIRRSESLNARLTHFMDDVLGGNHEIGAGFEYLYNFDRLSVTRGNPLSMTYYNGNPYYYQAQGMARATYGDGLISLGAEGLNDGDATKDLPGSRLSAYLQDSYTTLKNRLTINVGFRFDWYSGWFGGASSTGPGTSTLAYKVGAFVADTIGWNPYAAMTWGDIKNTFDSKTLSPRIGASYDLFGDGKTALKISFGRFYEAVPVMWYSNAQAYIQASYNFNWWDNNGNGVCDDPGVDSYAPTSGYWAFAKQDLASLKEQVAFEGEQYQLKPPYNNEFIVSLSHELAQNFSVKLQYVNKMGYRDHWDTWFNTAARQYLNSVADAPGFWVPFTTTVPGVGDWPTKTVTIYIPTANYDWDHVTNRQASNPYSKRQYNGVEMTFDKRYANGWALGGSVTYANSKSITPYDPNYAVNGWGADINDIPLAIKLYGTFNMPLGFIGSFIYRHLEGGPLNYGGSFWDKAMDVTIVVPDQWIADHNCVNWYNWVGVMLEPNGTHRKASWDNVDLRLEKEFRFGFGTVSFFADVFNLLGNKYVNVGLSPAGVWYPDGENTSSGTRELDYYYNKINSVTGVRTYKLSARVSF